MTRRTLPKSLFLSIAALAIAGTVFAQGAPFAGTPAPVTLTPSPASPVLGQDFTVDVNVNLSGVTGTCNAGSTPAVLGAYVLPIDFDNTRVAFVSSASCGNAQFGAPLSTTAASTANLNGTVVISDAQVASSVAPTGNVCVARLTFTPLVTGSVEMLADETDGDFSLGSAIQACSESTPAAIAGEGVLASFTVTEPSAVPALSVTGLALLGLLIAASGLFLARRMM